jgi:hypothetical protein
MAAQLQQSQQRVLRYPGMAGARFRSSLLCRTLVVVVATIVVLIVSAIVLPPKASQARPGDGSGETPLTAPH